MKQPNRYFRVSVKSGMQPELIVADTLEDAQCQADDIARHEKGKVIQFYEVFPLEIQGMLEKLNASLSLPSFEQQFNNIFAV
ncbi:MAG: hypothetical protein WCL34_08485 [Methylococcaceae bacterium]